MFTHRFTVQITVQGSMTETAEDVTGAHIRNSIYRWLNTSTDDNIRAAVVLTDTEDAENG